MLAEIVRQATDEMNRAVDSLKKGLSTIRTGRAHVSLLDQIRVDYYGSMSPLDQLANVTVPDPRMLMVKPWDKSQLKAIEKAIQEANLGLQPVTDGDFVRVPIPALTEERRKEFVKQARNRAEDAKIAVRNARRDANEMLKAAKTDGEIAEDEEKRGLKQVQDLTDKSIAEIDVIVQHKEAEIMTV